MLTVIYAVLSIFLYSQMENKIGEVAVQGTVVEQQKVAMDNDRQKVDDKTAEYTELIQNIEEKAKTDSESRRLKYSIPTLLNKIMHSIPANVQLTAIQNTGTKITITAQSDKQDQLGIFIAKLYQDGILRNVVSDTSRKEDDVHIVTIEGELP